MKERTNQEKYRELCIREPSISIFSKDWWLDALVGEEQWDVAIVEKGNDIVASLPYVTKSRGIFKVLTMPKLTPFIGVWTRPLDGKYVKKLSNEMDLYEQLIEKLPAYDYFQTSFHYSVTNWLPFYWKQFKQETNYTYVIENLENLDEVYENFKPKCRGSIKKAKQLVNVYSDDDIEKFYYVNKKTFDRQGAEMSYDLDYVKRLDAACAQKQCRKIFFAEDDQQRIHSVLYVVWDQQSAYCLMTGSDPQLRSSQANSLLAWEAIKYSASVTKSFDFEGSMIPGVEKFYRSFGAIQKPYLSISKTNSFLIKLRNFIVDEFMR
ncbi:GNAT family N-acetyltransferase [Bacillus mesophilus]|uniref:GNAT family N-acetyltransferase n=1 Tax=Bacillus mesophilus TaxID=1808955 RepID=UPI001EF7E7B7|nr:GNAT family N-acetyltransferase [Bacillus mesophilus]